MYRMRPLDTVVLVWLAVIVLCIGGIIAPIIVIAGLPKAVQVYHGGINK